MCEISSKPLSLDYSRDCILFGTLKSANISHQVASFLFWNSAVQSRDRGHANLISKNTLSEKLSKKKSPLFRSSGTRDKGQRDRSYLRRRRRQVPEPQPINSEPKYRDHCPSLLSQPRYGMQRTTPRCQTVPGKVGQ